MTKQLTIFPYKGGYIAVNPEDGALAKPIAATKNLGLDVLLLEIPVGTYTEEDLLSYANIYIRNTEVLGILNLQAHNLAVKELNKTKTPTSCIVEMMPIHHDHVPGGFEYTYYSTNNTLTVKQWLYEN